MMGRRRWSATASISPDGGVGVITGNVIEKGMSSVNENIIHFGGEGTYPVSSLFISGNTFINDRPGGAIALLNQTQDPNPGDPNYNANIPAVITGNTFYNVDPSNLFEDDFGPPFDQASNNVFLPGPGPALDTSPGYDVPEPASVAVLLFAVFSVSMLLIRKRSPAHVLLTARGFLTDAAGRRHMRAA